MSVSIGDFVGSWEINFATGPLTESGFPLYGLSYILIGTGTNGATVPCFDEKYQVLAGFALLDSTGTPLFCTADMDNQPGLLMLYGDQLRWKGYFKKQPTYIYVSLAELWTPDGERYTHVYGCTVYGDPDQVGVWGGTGNPPPNPPGGGAPPPEGSS
jgi:hypothetical protein